MNTYAYAIEISDDGRIWMMENEDATGVEETSLPAEQLARVVLDNRLADLASEVDMDGNPAVSGAMRVSVWAGTTIGDAQDVVAQAFAEG